MKDIKVFLKEKEKKKKQQYGHERYKKLSEYEKQKLVEYRKKHYKMRENTLLRNYFHLENLVFFLEFG